MAGIGHIKEMTRHKTLTACRAEVRAQGHCYQGEYQCWQCGQ